MCFTSYLMKQTKPKQTPPRMEVINKPKVAHTKKSLQFFLRDKRKMISAVFVILLPLTDNLWRIVPEGIPFPFYETLQMFVWTVGVHLLSLLVSLAWYLSIPRKDKVLQFISLSALAYSLLITFETLPFAGGTPLWLDMVVSGVIIVCLYFCIDYIKKNYLEKPDDYKTLHDGLVYDIHHQRFLSSINRVAGLLDVADMEEPYKHLCAEEIEELKESIAYIAEKYEALK